MAFPSSPVEGQSYTENNTVWIYSAVTGQWNRSVISQVNETTYIGADGAPSGIGGDTQVIFNSNGSFAGDSGLTYNKTTDALTSGSLKVTSLGTAAAPTISVTGDPNTGIYSPGADQLAISTNGSGRLFVTSDGKVGIGTSSPDQTLTVNGKISCIGSTGIPRVLIGAPSWSADYANFQNATLAETVGNSALNQNPLGATILNAASGQFIAFRNNNNDLVRITSTGLVGIGTTAPAKLLHVNASGGNQLLVRSTSTDNIIGSQSPYMQVDSVGGYTGSGSVTGLLVDISADSTTNKYAAIFNGGRVGIGTTSPGQALEVAGSGVFTGGVAGQGAIIGRDGGTGGATYSSQTGDVLITTASTTNIRFTTNSTERARIDTSGRLLVGTSSARSAANGGDGSFSTKCDIEGAGNDDSHGVRIIANSGTTNNTVRGSQIILGRTAGTSAGSSSAVADGYLVGSVRFAGADGTNLIPAAQIQAFVDGTPGTNDMPGRLVFSTTADGASSPTERMRIDNSGRLLVGTSSAVGNAQVVSQNGFASRSVSVTLNGTSTVAVPNGCICTMSTDGFPGDSAIFSIKSTGGSQGCYVLAQGTAGNIGFGTTSNPSTGSRLNVWISATSTMSIQDVGQGARTVCLTFTSVA